MSAAHKLDSSLLEWDIVSACHYQPNLIDQVRVEPKDFSSDAAGFIFAAQLALHERGDQVDTTNVRIELERTGHIGRAGIDEKLGRLGEINHIVTPVALERFHEIADLRRLRSRLMDALTHCEEGRLEAAQAAAEYVTAVRDEYQRGTAYSLREAAQEAIERLLRIEHHGRQDITLGLKCLDYAIGGVEPGNMVVIGADTSVGKSSLALAFALGQDKRGITAGIVTCEDAKGLWGQRAAAKWAGVSSLKMRTGLGREDYRHLAQRLGSLPDCKVHLESQIGKNDHDVCAAMRRLVRRHGAQILYVDYLQTIASSSNRSRPRRDEVREIAQRLKGQAEGLGVPLVVLSQLSRPDKNTKNREPTKFDLKETGDIENATEVVLLLWPDDENPTRLNLKVDKGKWGARRRLFQIERDASGSLIEFEEFDTGPSQERLW